MVHKIVIIQKKTIKIFKMLSLKNIFINIKIERVLKILLFINIRNIKNKDLELHTSEIN